MAEIKSELIQKIDFLNKKKTELLTKKTLLTKQLNELDAEIRKQGYDPEKLPETIQELTIKNKKFEDTATPIVEKIIKDLAAVDNETHTIAPFDGFES